MKKFILPCIAALLLGFGGCETPTPVEQVEKDPLEQMPRVKRGTMRGLKCPNCGEPISGDIEGPYVCSRCGHKPGMHK